MIVCINPWLDDFSAYDLWAKPLGLMDIYSRLVAHGAPVTYIDFLYQHYPEIPLDVRSNIKVRKDFRSEFNKTVIEKPSAYQSLAIPRHYYRYGLPESTARSMLLNIEKPTMFLVTSLMTYWYNGLHATIQLIRELYPDVPIILGGIYATLCEEHALQTSGADRVVTGNDFNDILHVIADYTDLRIEPIQTNDYTLRWDVYPELPYVPLRFSIGCPYHCPYCAGPLISGAYVPLRWEIVYSEFSYWYDKGIRHFALYDDAVLVDAKTGIKPFLRRLLHDGKTAFFHTPNAVHVNLFDDEMAELASNACFGTLRFGFETVRRGHTSHEHKTDLHKMEALAARLMHAGIPFDNVRIYLIAGMPMQHRDEVFESIEFIHSLGLRPIVNEYSPVPHTPMFEQACRHSPLPLRDEPLYQNNSIVPCRWEGLTYDDLQRLKREARG